MLLETRSKPTMCRLRAATLMAAMQLMLVACGEAAPEPETLRLRVAWGGGNAVRWAGRVSIAEGELSQLSLLGRERDTPGSVWLADGAVLVAQPRQRTFDGFDITATADTKAVLRIEMRAAGEETSHVVEIPLGDLMTTQHRSTLSSSVNPAGTTLLVHRLQDDAMRIRMARDSLIFAPGDILQLSLEPVIAGLTPGGSLDLTVELASGRRGKQEWSESLRVSLPPRGYASVPIEIPLPDREGVYTVKLTLRTPPGNRVKFWEAAAHEQLAQRTFQVVVLASEPIGHHAGAEWQTLLEIDPANPRWWNRLPDWTRIDRLALLNNGAMGSEPFRSTNHQGIPLAELSPGPPSAPAWQAYPLPAAEVGRPHVVEIELPADYAQRLVLRVVEPDANGKLVPTGPGGGVTVSEKSTGEKGLRTYRYLFWPRTKSPIAVIENASGTTSARYGKIRLRVAREGTIAPPSLDHKSRLVAAYFGWQAVLDRTSARTPTIDGRPPVDDLLTFYHAALRLASVLELSGYNAAIVNVLDDGSAAFDLGDYPTLPLLDTSRLGAGSTDLPAIDPLDLMMRVFSRRGLRLVPTLRFTATLPGVEAQLRKRKYRTLEEFPLWTNRKGDPRRSVQPYCREPLPPHYDFTHPDVAGEVRQVINALVDAASHYPAFAGIGIELPSRSYLTSPPAEFGITGPRLARLAESVGADSATLDTWIKQPDVMLNDSAIYRRWITHRTQPATEFYTSLAAEIEGLKPDAQLMLLASEMFDGGERILRPDLRTTNRTEELYLECGLDLAKLETSPSVTVPIVQHDVSGLELADAALPMQWNLVEEQRTEAGADPVAVWRSGTEVAMPRSSEFAPQTAMENRLVFTPLGEATNHMLSKLLYEGASGPLIMGGPIGPGAIGDDTRRQTLQLLTQLSANDQPTASPSYEQPVAARVFNHPGGCVALVTNDSPWSIKATVTLDVSDRTTAHSMTPGASTLPPTASYTAGRHAWPVSLGPHETQGLRFDQPHVEVTGVRVQVAPEVEKLLAARCAELERRDLKPDHLEPYNALENPSFEQIDASGMAVGWQSANSLPTVSPGIDGQRAARLTSTGDGVTIATAPFPVPATGQVAITAYVKVVDLADDAELRLVVEELEGAAQPRFIALSAERLKTDHSAKEWNAYQFGVEDLPLDSTATMQIRVELSGAGEVWIDHLQVHELVYPLRIYPKESDQQVLALVQHVKRPRMALDARHYRDCLTLLDSYWSQFVMAYLPEIKTPPADNVAPSNPAKQTEDDQPAPRLTDRIRDWFRF